MNIHYPTVLYTLTALFVIPFIAVILASIWSEAVDSVLKYIGWQKYVVQFISDKENRRRAIERQKESDLEEGF